MRPIVAVCVVVLAAVAVVASQDDSDYEFQDMINKEECKTNPPYIIEKVSEYKEVARFHDSVLYHVGSKYYSQPVLLATIKAKTHYDMGYAYGRLLGHQMKQNLDSLMATMFPGKASKIVSVFFDWQYSFWMVKHLPTEYLDEITGVGAGGNSIGVQALDVALQRMLVLSSIPGDAFFDLFYVLMDEIIHSGEADDMMADDFDASDVSLSRMLEVFAPVLEFTQQGEHTRNNEQCSMWAAWGSRTWDGSMLAGRNLDWAADTGLSQNKLVAIMYPPGGIPSIQIGFAGMIGPLVGMNAEGLTVAEAGEDVNKNRFSGTQWVMRLRHILESCKDMDCILKYWKASDNTCGTNHIMTSAHEAGVAGKHPAVCVETMARYTGYFFDNDPRENIKDTEGRPLGFPLKDAITRSNHAYDPTMRQHEIHNVKYGSGTFGRYMTLNRLIHKITEEEGKKLTLEDGVYMSHMAGQGCNVISTAMHAGTMEAMIAWENGHAAGWKPAKCGSYLHFDFSPFLTEYFEQRDQNLQSS